MHSFEEHSNESACRKSDRLGLEQVRCSCENKCFSTLKCKVTTKPPSFKKNEPEKKYPFEQISI